MKEIKKIDFPSNVSFDLDSMPDMNSHAIIGNLGKYKIKAIKINGVTCDSNDQIKVGDGNIKVGDIGWFPHDNEHISG